MRTRIHGRGFRNSKYKLTHVFTNKITFKHKLINFLRHEVKMCPKHGNKHVYCTVYRRVKCMQAFNTLLLIYTNIKCLLTKSYIKFQCQLYHEKKRGEMLEDR